MIYLVAFGIRLNSLVQIKIYYPSDYNKQSTSNSDKNIDEIELRLFKIILQKLDSQQHS